MRDTINLIFSDGNKPDELHLTLEISGTQEDLAFVQGSLDANQLKDVIRDLENLQDDIRYQLEKIS